MSSENDNNKWSTDENTTELRNSDAGNGINDLEAQIKDEGYTNKGFEADISNYPEKTPKEEDVEELDEGPQRDTFDSPMEFLLSIVSMSVGLGNIWRFPFTAYENGGGAFIIPYLIILFLIGKPIYYMELTLGQFSSYGQVKCWKLSPFFKGVGFASTLASYCVVTYYTSIIALTVFYFFASFQADLPWTNCKESWAGADVCYNITLPKLENDTSPLINLPQLYFNNEVLKAKVHIGDGIGYPEWRLTLCLLFSWLMVFFTLIRGVKSSGKVAYFTALYPYVILLMFLIIGLTKEGSSDGIIYLLKPQWEKMYDPKLWFAAVGQCFFSLATGFGSIIMFASYNPFRHNVYRDSIIVSLVDTFTSLLAACTVFAILGSLAHDLGVDVSVVSEGGPGLLFVSYADAISKIGWAPQLFSVLFFLMVLALGVGTAVSLQMAVITTICDQFPKLKKLYVTAGTCLSCFLVGLIYVTPGGQHMLTLVDHFGGGFVIYVLATLEVVGIVWVYGLSSYCKDVEFMLNMRVNWFWRITWGVISPVALIVILAYFLVQYENLKHNGVDYPSSALASGWILAAVCLALVPIGAIHSIRKTKGDTYKEKLMNSFKPRSDWGPRSPKLRAEWKIYKDE